MSQIEKAPVEEQQAPVVNENLEDALGAEWDKQSEEAENTELETIREIDDVEEVALPAEEDEEGVKADAETPAEEIEEESEYDEAAPERWPDDMKQAYDAMNPDQKKLMMEKVFKPMQRQYTQSTQEIAEIRKGLGPMLDTMQRHSQEFEQAGIDPVEAFNRQMAWSAHFARVGPEQGAKELAQAYGQAPGQQENVDTAYLTPVEKAQKTEIEGLKSQLNEFGQTLSKRDQQAQDTRDQAAANEVRNSITSFASEMKDGVPVHPHVEKVSMHMAGLIRGGLVARTDEYGQPIPYMQQLGSAYKLACEMDPSIRGARDTKTRAEQVNKAKLANREVVSKTLGSDVVVDDGPLSETISKLYDDLDK